MDDYYIWLGISVSFGVNFFLLYTRKQNWNTDLFRWSISGLLFILGLSLYLIESISIDNRFFSWNLRNSIILKKSNLLYCPKDKKKLKVILRSSL